MISLIAYCCQLALAGIILWYVLGFLAIPDVPKLVAQCLLVLVLVLSAISAVTAGPPPASLSQRLPSINAPAPITK
jgi:hypothetical protein